MASTSYISPSKDELKKKSSCRLHPQLGWKFCN